MPNRNAALLALSILGVSGGGVALCRKPIVGVMHGRPEVRSAGVLSERGGS